jgi:hypothetical protein
MVFARDPRQIIDECVLDQFSPMATVPCGVRSIGDMNVRGECGPLDPDIMSAVHKRKAA